LLLRSISHVTPDLASIRGFSTTMRYINRHYLSIYLSSNRTFTRDATGTEVAIDKNSGTLAISRFMSLRGFAARQK